MTKTSSLLTWPAARCGPEAVADRERDADADCAAERGLEGAVDATPEGWPECWAEDRLDGARTPAGCGLPQAPSTRTATAEATPRMSRGRGTMRPFVRAGRAVRGAAISRRDTLMIVPCACIEPERSGYSGALSALPRPAA